MPMPAPKGTQPPGGSRKGKPNKIGADVRAMALAALDRAGGVDYLHEQANANPKAFLTLIGRIIPTQITGRDDAPLIPERASDPQSLATALVLALRSVPPPRTSDRLADAAPGTGPLK